MTSTATQNAAVIAALSTPAAIKALTAFAAANAATPAPTPTPAPAPAPTPAPTGNPTTSISAAPATSPPQFAWAQLAAIVLNDWTAKTEITVGGTAYFSEDAGKTYDIGLATNSTTDLTRFEVIDSEEWTSAMGGNDTVRAELDGSASTLYGHNIPFCFAYDITIEQGAPLITTGGGDPGGPDAWCVISQVHGDGNEAAVPWQMSLVNECLSFSIQNDPGQTWVVLYTEPKPMPRGTTRRVVVNMSVGGTSADFCNVWLDGVQVVNYKGVIGSATPDPHVYFKFGVYLGWENTGLPPLAVWYSNVKQSAGTALLSRVTNPPALPVAH